MKRLRQISAVIVCVLLLCILPGQAEAAGTSVRVALPGFDVTLSWTTFSNDYSKYPFLVYSGITYFPMTYYDCRLLGLTTSWSAAVIPVRISHTKMMTVAEAMAISACSRINDKIWSSVPGSMPPVSTKSNVRPRHSAWAYSRSRVTPGVSSTMDNRLPVSL